MQSNPIQRSQILIALSRSSVSLSFIDSSPSLSLSLSSRRVTALSVYPSKRRKMSLGKRMRRTTSLLEFPPVPIGSDPAGFDPTRLDPNPRERQRTAVEAELTAVVEVAEFLRACGICKRGLGAGKDTFIYRGDAAFCSLECREKQMKLDEMKEKCSRKSMKPDAPPPPKARPQAATGNSETVAAA